jgi:hypothetical protein
MNPLLSNLVTLNKIMLRNAQAQFKPYLPQANSLLAAKLPDNLTASVETVIVSGETRYQIETTTDGTSWQMTLQLSLNQTVSEIPYIVLSFTLLGQNQEMVFESVEHVPNSNKAYTAKLSLNKLEQRDALIRALNDIQSETTLVVLIRNDTGMLNTVTDPQIFFFPNDYYSYIYKGIKPPTPRLELIKIPIEFEQVTYNYYQDNLNKQFLNYFPDLFELAKNSEQDNKPMISISFSAPEKPTNIDEYFVTFNYFLLPKVNHQRIESATQTFQKTQSDGQLVPFANAYSLSLELILPDGKTPQEKSIINLQSGISGAFTVTASQFSQVWDALFDDSPQRTLLRGNLVAELEGFNPNNIPVSMTMNSAYNDPKSFIDQSAPVDIYQPLQFKSDDDLYNPEGPKPVKRILVNLGNQTFELNKGTPEKTVEVKVSALEQILHPETDLVYHYDLQIMYTDGTKKTLNNQSSTFEIIYVP